MTEWFVVETHGDGLEGKFGPFATLEAAMDFSRNNLFDWAEDNLSKITFEKETNDD